MGSQGYDPNGPTLTSAGFNPNGPQLTSSPTKEQYQAYRRNWMDNVGRLPNSGNMVDWDTYKRDPSRWDSTVTPVTPPVVPPPVIPPVVEPPTIPPVVEPPVVPPTIPSDINNPVYNIGAQNPVVTPPPMYNPEITGGSFVQPPTMGNTNPVPEQLPGTSWYTPTNVKLPPGVDPYYGVSITGINGSSSGGTTSPIDQDGTGGGKGSTGSGKGIELGKDYDWTADWTASPLTAEERQAYSMYLMQGGNESETAWWALKNALGGSNSNTDSSMNSSSRNFNIARPNMTWVGGLPSVAPLNGQQMANTYGPSPYTMNANTPNFNYTPQQLTYNNPYNTNPYLPMANPFALIANTPTSGS